MPEPTTLGIRMKRFRERKGFTQYRLSKAAKVPRSTIAAVEAGLQEYVSLPAAMRIADALGITIDSLVRGDPLEEDEPDSMSDDNEDDTALLVFKKAVVLCLDTCVVNRLVNSIR